MIFGKIDYLNLLPFYVFMKKNLKDSSSRCSFFNKKGVPSKINRLFYKRAIDGAFISSIRSKNRKCLDIGIIAQNEVRSVLVLTGESEKRDPASETSNVLAKILGIKGRVVIGDNALKEYYKNQSFKDLALLWRKKYNLPFVFARLCTNRNHNQIKKIQKNFLKTKVKIPMYILKQKERETGIKKEHILEYLEYISYKIDKKEKKSLKKFLNFARKVK